MKKVLLSVGISLLTLGLFAVPVLCPSEDTDPITVPIVISPSTINLESEGVWVTVHAEIPNSSVIGLSVTLNGVEVIFTKADNRGDLVAKFYVDDVKDEDIIEPDTTAILMLSGMTCEGVAFSGTDTIKVIEVSGKK